MVYDLYGESKLAVLLKELCKIKGIEWIRFLYSYPEGITDELIETVANEILKLQNILMYQSNIFLIQF